MGFEITLPDLGDGIESGDILDVLVQAGDSVTKDQGVVELETDKATVEVPAGRAGQITKVHVAVGQTVQVGATLFTMELSEVGSATLQEREPTASPPQQVPTPPSAAVARPTQAEAPSDPAPVQTPEKEQPPSAASVTASAPAVRKKRSSRRPVPAGPAIRRFAREVGVDLDDVQGSGPGGRVTRNDVLDVVRNANRLAKENGAALDADADLPGEPGQDEFGPVRIESASRIRRTIANKMHESWSIVARVTNFDDADVTELEKVRQASKEDYAANGIKLTSMPFVVKAVSMSLRKHPLVNASYDGANSEIIYKRYVNIGMAVDTERGLVVPVLRKTNQLSISEIARLIDATANRIRSNDFGLDDLRGSTFTISNLGSIGGTYSTPIVNVPEVAILLTGRARQLPVVVDDQVVVRLMMPLSLSYDHRIIDGATAARFLNDVIAYLKAPSRLLLAP